MSETPPSGKLPGEAESDGQIPIADDLPGGEDLVPPQGRRVGVNVIPLTQERPGDAPVVAFCPYCGADLATVTLGRYVEGPRGKGIQAFYPLRCPECKHPLLYMATGPQVIRAHGPV